MGWFRQKKTVNHYDFPTQASLGMIGMDSVHGTSDGGVIVKNVKFVDCRFGDETNNATFIDCEYENCEFNLSIWQF